MKHRIAVYPGDGIGPEVVDHALRVLEAAGDDSFALDFHRLPWGVDHYFAHGQLVPPDFLEILRGYDAIFLGAVGDPARLPDHVTLAPLVRIRQTFNQYANIRPARLLPGVPSFLIGKGPADIDLVVLRENSEGEYIDMGGRFHVGCAEESATQVALHTRRGITRILRFGFEMARARRGHLTMATKSNALKYGFVLWDELLEEIHSDYPDVRMDKMHVDALAMQLVRSPERFDVIVASNLFGDVLSEIGGLLGGGLGMSPSANINPDRQYPSMFEPIHGSAPDIVGKGIANPIGMILSGAMMLEWLGETAAAERVRAAVAGAVASGAGTPDLRGNMTSLELTDCIIAHLSGRALSEARGHA